jgi:hypothetical protein
MTPTLTDILTGNALALASLAEETGGAEFSGAKISVVALLSLLAAQEAERAIAVREAENAAIAELLGIEAPEVTEHSISALDAANAELRRRLIALTERWRRAATRTPTARCWRFTDAWRRGGGW